MKRLLVFFAMLAMSVSFVAPLSAASNARTATAQRPTQSDAQIDATIRAKLAKSKIGKDGFRFHVQRGVVTWEGNTNVVQHKGSATRMAKAAGAVQVVNNIHVNGSGVGKVGEPLKKASVQ